MTSMMVEYESNCYCDPTQNTQPASTCVDYAELPANPIANSEEDRIWIAGIRIRLAL